MSFVPLVIVDITLEMKITSSNGEFIPKWTNRTKSLDCTGYDYKEQRSQSIRRLFRRHRFFQVMTTPGVYLSVWCVRIASKVPTTA